MSKELLSALVQLLISLGGAGLVVQLLMLRQNRRKIAGEASTSEANAASTLSGAALQMVENAQVSAREADTRADKAYEEAQVQRAENERLWTELNKARWKIHHLEMREAILEGALKQANIDVPPPPTYQEHETYQPPTENLGNGPAGPVAP